MYDNNLCKTIISDLESKTINVVNTSIVLASQGYLVNKSKTIRLNWSSVLLHAFDNINIFTKEQQHKLELLYNKISTL